MILQRSLLIHIRHNVLVHYLFGKTRSTSCRNGFLSSLFHTSDSIAWNSVRLIMGLRTLIMIQKNLERDNTNKGAARLIFG